MRYKIATVTHLESHATKIAVSLLESGEQCCKKAIIIISFHVNWLISWLILRKIALARLSSQDKKVNYQMD